MGLQKLDGQSTKLQVELFNSVAAFNLYLEISYIWIPSQRLGLVRAIIII